MEKKLYPMIFLPIGSKKPWGGTELVRKLGKTFTEIGEDGEETAIPPDEKIGESWELADMGHEDSVVTNGWLAGNTIGDIMETYMERVVGDKVFEAYGTQFPLLIKFLDIQEKLSVQVHPDDEIAAQRYDSLGKKEMWYVMDAGKSARAYVGFKRDVTASEFYEHCHKGTADQLLNEISPKKGDVLHIAPGTVHAADGGILICEIQESSDLTFRLYDWGRELNPATARPTHLDEAIDLIDYGKAKPELYTTAAQNSATRETPVKVVADEEQFTVSDILLHDSMHINFGQMDKFLVYCCLDGEVTIQMPEGQGVDKEYRIRKGDVILIPAECPDFILNPVEKGSHLLEATVNVPEAKDSYTNS